MKREPGKGSWACPKTLARVEAVRFVEEAATFGSPLRRAVQTACEQQGAGIGGNG